MEKQKGYDAELQMFVDAAHEPTQESLNFLRWLAEQGKLEHDIAGPPSGEYAQSYTEQPLPIAATVYDAAAIIPNQLALEAPNES